MMQVLNSVDCLTFRKSANIEFLNEDEEKETILNLQSEVLEALVNYLCDNNYITICTTTNSVNKNVEVFARICARKE